ncbi:MAG: transposase, partial [Firmicutes bacterium]|nr:transposase [Bacillota bacterium]
MLSALTRRRHPFTRNVAAQVPKQAQPAISASVRQILAQPTRREAQEDLARAADKLAFRFPKVAEMLLEAEADILCHMDLPSVHWRQIRSTNGLERLNREIARRFDVVGIFPGREAVLRLGGAVLAEQDDEWLTSRR